MKPQKVLWSLWSPRVFPQKCYGQPMVSPMVTPVVAHTPPARADRVTIGDHGSDHRGDHSTFRTKQSVTIVTIALFGVSTPGSGGHGQNGHDVFCLNRARCGTTRRRRTQRGTQQTKTKWTFPGAKSIKFAHRKVHFEPSGAKEHPKTN